MGALWSGVLWWDWWQTVFFFLVSLQINSGVRMGSFIYWSFKMDNGIANIYLLLITTELETDADVFLAADSTRNPGIYCETSLLVHFAVMSTFDRQTTGNVNLRWAVVGNQEMKYSWLNCWFWTFDITFWVKIAVFGTLTIPS